GILRVLSDGTPDPGFGAAGRVVVPFMEPEFAIDVVIDPDGHIVAAGRNDFALVRCATDGSLDPTFGVGGIVTNPGLLAATHLIRDPAGRYVVTDGPHVARFDSLGALDPSFGTGGIVSLPSGYGAAAVVRQSDGKLVLTGSRSIAPGDNDIWVGRLDAGGSA